MIWPSQNQKNGSSPLPWRIGKDRTMTEYSKDTIETYWQMMGVTEWDHRTGFVGEDKPAQECHNCHCLFPETKWKSDKRLGDYIYKAYSFGGCSVPDPIPLSPAELAFFMRDKCSRRKFSDACGNLHGNVFPGFLSAEEWIDAAVSAWKGQTDGQEEKEIDKASGGNLSMWCDIMGNWVRLCVVQSLWQQG